MSQINISEAIAASVVLEMGEVAERIPLCLVEDIKKIVFVNKPPSLKELTEMTIKPSDDIYGPLLTSVNWLTN